MNKWSLVWCTMILVTRMMLARGQNSSTSKLAASDDNRTLEVDASESASASILKLSHQPAPSRLQATGHSKHQQQSGQPEKEAHNRAGQQASDKARRVAPDPIHAPPVLAWTTQADSARAKRKGLISFMTQPRKLSLGSLLPLRPASGKPPVAANASSQPGTATNIDNQRQASQNNLLASALAEEELNGMFNEPNAFGEAPTSLGSHLIHHARFVQHPLEARQHQLPPPMQLHQDPHHHHHMTSLFEGHQSPLASNFEAGHLRGSAVRQAPFGAQAPQLAFVSSLHRAAPHEMFLADQSSEHYKKIKLSKLNQFPSGGNVGNNLPLILASTSQPGGDSSQTSQLNRTALLQAAAQQLTAAAVAQAQQQQPQPQPQPQRQSVATGTQAPPSGNGSAALSSVAAAVLLSERAKSLISQLNSVAAATNASKSNVRNNRDAALVDQQQQQQQQAGNTTGSNNLGLASMIKNAAEVWATTNGIAAPSAASGSFSAHASPTIVVEHDGPTVTTLDYGPQRPPVPPNQGPDDEDDVAANFYTESEETEQEEGGSHEARRVVRPRAHHHGRRLHHREPPSAPEHHHQSFRHPDFGDGAQSAAFMTGHRGRGLASSANEFFEEQHLGEHNSDGPQGPSAIDQVVAGDYGPPAQPSDGYHHQPQRPQPPPAGKGHYPDSINAIKEQDERQASRGKQPQAGGSSPHDAVEQLIRELQELRGKRKLGGGKSRQEEQERRTNGGSPRGASSDEFEDILSASGQDPEGQQQEEGPADEDEQARSLRHKLLARLRAKHDKKKGAMSGGGASSFSGGSIRIPLHALLLAALDRRMSSSEPMSQSVSAGGGQLESATNNGILDERNRDLLLSGRQDFNEATADLGSLLEGNNLFEQIMQSATGGRGAQQGQNQQQNREQPFPSAEGPGDPLKLPLNLQNVYQESLTPAGMLLIENLAALDESNQRKIHFGSPGGGDLDPASFMPSATTRVPAASATTSTSTSTSTTVAPASSSSQTSGPPAPGPRDNEPEIDLQRHRGRLQNHHRGSKNHRDTAGLAARGQKGRRALREEEGDFDVNRHVEEYASDRDDKSLEPSWMKAYSKERNSRRARQREGPSVEFDDEFDEIDRQTRRKMQLKRPRNRNKGPSGQGEANYEANEQRFFNKMQRDTDANIGDVDQTIRGIEQSIPENSEPPRQAHQRARSDESDEGAESSDASGGEEDEPADEDTGGETSDSRVRTRSHRSRSPEAAETQQSAATLKASLVDDEIRRMEEEAKGKRERRRPTRRPTDPDEDDKPDHGLLDQDNGGEPAESQLDEARRMAHTTGGPRDESEPGRGASESNALAGAASPLRLAQVA